MLLVLEIAEAVAEDVESGTGEEKEEA